MKLSSASFCKKASLIMMRSRRQSTPPLLSPVMPLTLSRMLMADRSLLLLPLPLLPVLPQTLLPPPW
eukprot:4567591-Prorocentrum_lima.AAC.1